MYELGHLRRSRGPWFVRSTLGIHRESRHSGWTPRKADSVRANSVLFDQLVGELLVMQCQAPRYPAVLSSG
jgi:hypothetical protein